jgi:hypothetical protein
MCDVVALREWSSGACDAGEVGYVWPAHAADAAAAAIAMSRLERSKLEPRYAVVKLAFE